MGVPLFGANSRLDIDTVTAGSVPVPGFPLSNLFDDRSFTVFKTQATLTSMTINTNAGATGIADVDYFFLAGHDLNDPAKDGLGAVKLEFEASNDGIGFANIFTVTPSDNKIIARSFPQVKLFTVLPRFFRIVLSRAAAFQASLGEMQWGKGVRPPLGFAVGFDPDDQRVMARFNRTQVGNLVGSTVNFIQRQAEINFPRIEDSFVSGVSVGDFKDFWDNHARLLKPFLFLWNSVQLATDVTNEKQAFWAMVDPGGGIQRPLVTQVDVGFRDLRFRILGEDN
jgi:hypothetical protein